MRFLRLPLAFIICIVAILLPYHIRARYMSLLAVLAHIPFRIFGYLTRKLLAALEEKNPYEIK